MPRNFLGLSAALAGLLTACNGGIGVTDASSYSSTTNNPSSDPGSNSDSNSASNSDPTTTTAGTGTGGSGTGDDSSGSGDSSGAPVTTGPTSGPTTGDSTGDSTTGEPGACKSLGAVDYGNCDMFLGYAYDGISCRAFSGCDCGADCDLFFASALDCATGCAGLGGCNQAAIHAVALAMDPVQVGGYCDDLSACAVQDTDAANWLAALFPGLSCGDPGMCQQGQACSVPFDGNITPEVWEQICAASLLPNAELYCTVFGP